MGYTTSRRGFGLTAGPVGNGERLNALQSSGLVLAIVAVGLITFGPQINGR